MALTVVLAYDIAADSRRTRLAAALEGWGYRIQESVFSLRLEDDELGQVRTCVDEIIDADDDVVHIYPLCAACLARGWQAARPSDALTLMPMSDGGPGSSQAIAPERIASREVIQAQGPLGQVREVDLVRMAPSPSNPGGRRPARAGPGSSTPPACWRSPPTPIRPPRKRFGEAAMAWVRS